MSEDNKQNAKYYNAHLRVSIYKYISKNRAKINVKRNERYLINKEANPEEVKRKIHERYMRQKARKANLLLEQLNEQPLI